MEPIRSKSFFKKWVAFLVLSGAVALQFMACDSTTDSTYNLPTRYFKDSVQAIFGEKCFYCHGDHDGTGYFNTGGSDSGWVALDLTSANAYTSLVGSAGMGVPAYERQFSSSVPRLRVKPGFPDSSYIIHKITKNPPEYGGRMPLNDPDGLTAAEIATIRKWIQYGAPLGDTTTH